MTPAPKFAPSDYVLVPEVVFNPHERWQTILSTGCTFPADIFDRVLLNLIKNPNITSSHLFRADILYDSGEHVDVEHYEGVHATWPSSALLAQLRAEYRPRPYQIQHLRCRRTIVRELIPRNPQVDRPLIQTCHLYSDESNDPSDQPDSDEQQHLVVFIPHVDSASEMPFYHPVVQKLAFSHRWSIGSEVPGIISIAHLPFDSPSPPTTVPDKLYRTFLRLLQTIHKHGQGQLAGYEKRVQLDRLIPQKRYQDTYTRLKTKYARRLTEIWVEVTDPGKHVFEDLGIATFLIELWRDMYALPSALQTTTGEQTKPLPEFPGFVDIGCGNGLLVFILLSEGYPGWGFDARERKTWSIFTPEVRSQLQQRVLVPRVLTSSLSPNITSMNNNDGSKNNNFLNDQSRPEFWHDGVFAPNTFVISNHADELTPWTPLLAALNHSAFIAIPCCSHDLSGARFRAPPTSKGMRDQHSHATTISTEPSHPKSSINGDEDDKQQDKEKKEETSPSTMMQALSIVHTNQAAESGSLKRPPTSKTVQSAYATLCSYVASLTEEMGFVAETEVLRIPSTRNHCIIGRTRRGDVGQMLSRLEEDGSEIERLVKDLVQRETGRGIDHVAQEWIDRAQKLSRKPPSGH